MLKSLEPRDSEPGSPTDLAWFRNLLKNNGNQYENAFRRVRLVMTVISDRDG